MHKFFFILIDIIRKIILFVCCWSALSCFDNDAVTSEESLETIPYAPQAYSPSLPSYFPNLLIPSDNPLTIEGITLGRDIFFDKILSANNSMSCSSCHHPEKAFTDGKKNSVGIDGVAGTRSSMSLVNIGFTKNGMFWDGRSKTLETQALLPVEDPIELHAKWPDIEERLQNHKDYPTKFRQAFGIKTKSEIKKELVAKALAQYQRAIISADSKYDRVKQGKEKFTDLELIGLSLYIDDPLDDLPDAECHHCHQLDLATADNYFNNGLQAANTLNDFQDRGLGGFTGNIAENGKMKATTLRNIFLSAPYMHDGRFSSIDEVLDHYNENFKNSPNKDALIHKLNLTPFHKEALKAFLKTLTDTSYLQNPLIVKK
ncbi:MAG: hypothetical protein RLZZ546_621 [Bacteroidota bacterium]|jgi:cytochrome c peroxidase